MVVHYAGISCDMDQIVKIAKKYKLVIIEDAAQAILSKYNGKPLGSIEILLLYPSMIRRIFIVVRAVLYLSIIQNLFTEQRY